jgi:hypothetical protein
MNFDPDEMTPGGRTWRQIWADHADNVKAANLALASMQGRRARWWGYMVSHCTFEMVVGEPFRDDNIVLSMPGCDYLSGPVWWLHQHIEVKLEYEPDNPVVPSKFTLNDPTVEFHAVGKAFRWQRNFDISAHHGWYGRRAGSHPPMKIEQTLEVLEKSLREFYDGQLNYDDLQSRIDHLLWYMLPIVKMSKPGCDSQEDLR